MLGFGPGGIRTQIAPIDLQWEKHKKIFFSETTRPKAFIFGV